MKIPIEILFLFLQVSGIILILIGVCGFSFILGKYVTWSTGINEMKRRCQHVDKIYYDKGKYKWRCLNCGYKLKK